MSRQEKNPIKLPSRNLINETSSSNISDQSTKKNKKAIKVISVIAAVIIGLLLIVALTLIVLLFAGQKRALGDNKIVGDTISVPSEAAASVASNESDPADSSVYVYYDGKKYTYNEKVTTILFAGIDKHADEQLGTYGTAGQADSIIVAALNTETGKYKLMAVSRDSMVDVNVYDPKGNFTGTEKQQVCLAYAYGDGKELSCENLKKSISRIFFGVPINAYAAVDLDAIPILNDAVGGVEVDVIEDLSHKDPELYLGAHLRLYGSQAETFVRTRDIYGDENQNNLRMERQKEYLTNFIRQTLDMTKQDITTPVKLYNSVTDYLVTDIDASMITYYTSVFLKSGFSPEDNFVKIPGTTTHSEKYAEYYVDNEALFKMILDIYYVEVKE